MKQKTYDKLEKALNISRTAIMMDGMLDIKSKGETLKSLTIISELLESDIQEVVTECCDCEHLLKDIEDEPCNRCEHGGGEDEVNCFKEDGDEDEI